MMENKFELIANALGELDEEQFMEELNALIKADPTEDTANEAVKACAIKSRILCTNCFK